MELKKIKKKHLQHNKKNVFADEKSYNIKNTTTFRY